MSDTDLELNNDTVKTAALGPNARLFGAESAAAARPSSYGRAALVATVLDQIDTDDLTEGSTQLLMTVEERGAVNALNLATRASIGGHVLSEVYDVINTLSSRQTAARFRTSSATSAKLLIGDANTSSEVGLKVIANALALINGTTDWTLDANGNLVPSTDNSDELGGASNRLANIHATKITAGNTSMVINTNGSDRWEFVSNGVFRPVANGTLNIGGGSNAVLSLFTHGVNFVSVTAANIASAAHAVNTANKIAGRVIFDVTNSRLMIATGSTATSNWVSAADPSTTVTPS